MDRRTFFADVGQASRNSNVLTLLRRGTSTSSVTGFAAGYFFKISYVILNTIIVVGG